jgi:hypothetical protein
VFSFLTAIGFTSKVKFGIIATEWVLVFSLSI